MRANLATHRVSLVVSTYVIIPTHRVASLRAIANKAQELIGAEALSL
jgi:hypothetical protein